MNKIMTRSVVVKKGKVPSVVEDRQSGGEEREVISKIK
jgi:hypothetical protein